MSNLTNFPNGITSFGVPIFGGSQDISGSTYFVDNNSGSDSNDGSSWEKAFKTFAKATTISNLDIARGSDRWARRNTIYYAADTETATLVAFPNKCDVIGVGSYDANKKPGITGIHAPVNAGNYGTRFCNILFKATATASPIITLASTSSGIEFHGCTFDGSAGTVTRAILATASPFLVVKNCDFFGTFATGYMAFGTGETAGTLIEGNNMHGSAGLGISTVTGTTSSYQTIIKGNFISVTSTGLIIDDDANGGAGILYVLNNTCMNGATLTNAAGWTGGFDVNAARCVGNTLTGADITVNAPTITIA